MGCGEGGAGKFGGPPQHEVGCRSLQAYAAACQAAGGELQEWRGGTNCSLPCPPNSHYSLCTRSPELACAALLAQGTPPRPPRCFEGCECDRGFLFDGGGCVPPSSCGCLHRGRYFQIAQTLLSPDCSESCTCRSAGGISCRPAACPFGQSCGHQDGVRACVDQPGRCTLAPASRFVSFDGATTMTTVATGIYVAVAPCDHGRPNWFRLLVAVAEVQDRPAVVALHLFTPEVFLTLKKDKKVWVNGVPSTLPVEISTTLTINETRGTLWVTQAPQLAIGLSPGGEVTVTVTQDLGHHLCGICGNYDGKATNDLRGPDGTLVGDAVALAKAWRAPDFAH